MNWPILMGAQPDGGGGGMVMLIWFGLIFVVMYMLMIRPQRKKQKEHESLLAELSKGDKVVTSSGLIGVIFAIDEERNRVVLKTGGENKLEFLKSSIAAKLDK
ncbi:MAG: preprotein translocase subunit YajC [bacterium]|nr:preprotein translocase subunit YajC [bacterium]